MEKDQGGNLRQVLFASTDDITVRTQWRAVSLVAGWADRGAVACTNWATCIIWLALVELDPVAVCAARSTVRRSLSKSRCGEAHRLY